MKITARVLSIFGLSLLVLILPVSVIPPVVANSSKPTSDQFEDPEEAMDYEKYNDLINGGSVYDDPVYQEIGAVLAIDYMIAYLDKTYTTVSSQTGLIATDVTTILTEITGYKQGLTNQKNSLETRFYEDGTEELARVRSVITEVDTYCDEIFVRVHYWNGLMMQSRLNNVYIQLTASIDNLDSTLKTMSTDVSDAQASLETAKTKQATLATQKDLSAKKFAAIKEKSTADEYLTQGKQYVREAQVTAEALRDSLNTAIFYLEN